MTYDYLYLFANGLKYTLLVCAGALLLGILLGGILYFISTLRNIIFHIFYY